MGRVLSLACTLALAAGLAACGSGDDGGSSTPAAVPSTPGVTTPGATTPGASTSTRDDAPPLGEGSGGALAGDPGSTTDDATTPEDTGGSAAEDTGGSSADDTGGETGGTLSP